MIVRLARLATTTLFSPYLNSSLILLHAPRFGFAFFKNGIRNKDFAITERIKRCGTSEEIMDIINKHGYQLNMVHLTAILDRIEEQNMLNIEKIVQYVVHRLSREGEFFRQANGESIRTVCNIVCYLGNLKNKELNHIFAHLNYPRLLANPKTLETTMLITGLIRLDLFKQVFGLQTQQSKKKILLEEIIGESYTRNQILSIWYAYISQISKENQSLNNHLSILLARVKQGGLFDLRTYTYALVCYVSCSHTFRDPASGPLYKLIRDEIPYVSKAILLPYQFSLLLHNIKQLKRQRSQLDSQSNAAKDAVVFPQEFIELLQKQFEGLCKRRNVTLRNVANSFKQFKESFGVKEYFLLTATQKANAILGQQMTFAEKSESYGLDFKVDLLSFSSLVWKLSESFQEFKPFVESQALLKKFGEATVKYLKVLKTKNLLERMTSREILMIYSGLVLIKQQKALDLDQQFTILTSSLIANQQRKYTAKQATLILTYLKKIKLVSTSLCDFFKITLTNLQNTQQFASNPTAKQFLKKKCVLGAGNLCLNCFQSHPSPQ